MITTLYKADGTISEITPANGTHWMLNEMQKLVGGWVEPLPLTKKLTMYFNEEGLRLKLPVNENATKELRKYFGEATVELVGDVVICDPEMFK